MSNSSEATVIQNFFVPHFSTFLHSFVPKTSLPSSSSYYFLSLQRFRNTRNKSSMADAASEVSETQSTEIPSGKHLSHFLWKAGLFTLVLVLIPVLPSLVPESLNQTLHARSWELLQLILVGIAVSYGLFSKKNDESGKDHHDSKLDNAQSYLSRLLQASSFFDDESENQAEIDDNEVQTWSSQYYREEPVFVVTKEKTAPIEEDHNSEAKGYVQKPLLLPVRTLKLGVSDSEQNEVNPSADQFHRESTKQRNVDENIVLRSPIPWRSQSGRMEMKENGDKKSRLESKSFRANSSPFASFSWESQDKSAAGAGADVWTTNSSSFSYSPPPPAPPPPPVRPPSIKKSVLFKSNSQVIHNAPPHRDKALKKREMSAPMEYEMKTRPLPTRTNSGKLGISVGTFRSNESVEKKIHIDSTATKRRIHHNKDDEDSEAEDDVDFYEGNSVNEQAAADDGATSDAGPDVDRKADEFIAKFREQIRLQRIQSIRRSTPEGS